MSDDPDKIRQDIERTRAELSSDVDALADKVSPSSIAHRQVESARSTLTGVKEKVMGKASDAKTAVQERTPGLHSSDDPYTNSGPGIGERASSAVSSAQGAVQQAPGAVRQQAQGNPLAAGLIAFGAGWLVSSLLPASSKEQQAASSLKEKATSGPVKQKLTDAAHEVQDTLRGPAQDAVQSLKSTAQDAVASVKDEAQSATSDVQDSAMQAKETVQSNATR
ncbi:DUF3618 domain-containing protein [Motilibacter aurantiacus]|uniref:DUF3618 domain-containing protein n=1 Tax=Motilibacter aurantiacus TaxID=2714955 RepID=UPI00140D6F8E|nr:DUF3618 domain-containing protein [Motilibacter aurantiacus]NHC47252.1 DUF3618 domain-containing protein [Motilibacter aurantiacus]